MCHPLLTFHLPSLPPPPWAEFPHVAQGTGAARPSCCPSRRGPGLSQLDRCTGCSQQPVLRGRGRGPQPRLAGSTWEGGRAGGIEEVQGHREVAARKVQLEEIPVSGRYPWQLIAPSLGHQAMEPLRLWGQSWLPVMAVPSGTSYPMSLSQIPCLSNGNGNSNLPCVRNKIIRSA